jgi:ribosomal protein S18 acetylase RimI-like enzyme
VEDDNPRARALYERLGYREVGREAASWNVEDADGNCVLYETELAVLRKDL